MGHGVNRYLMTLHKRFRVALVLIPLVLVYAAINIVMDKESSTPMQTLSSSDRLDQAALKSEINDLASSVDRWRKLKIGFIAFAGILALLSVVFEIMQDDATIKLSAAQDRLTSSIQSASTLAISQTNERAAAADERAGQANERAAKAEQLSMGYAAAIAGAEERAAEASAKAEGFRLDIARAEAQAAEANRIAEQERLARIQLEARLADRVITPDQERRIKETFEIIKGQTVDVVIVGDTPEVNRTATAIIRSIQSAGVPFNFFRPLAGGGAQGVIVGIRADAPEGERHAGTQLVVILRETLGRGVGLADFDNIAVSGTGTVGNTTGAAEVGTATLRLLIAPKP